MIRMFFLSFAIFFFGIMGLQAQDQPAHPTTIGTGTFLGISKPLHDLPAMTQAEFQQMMSKAESRERNEELRYRSYPFASTALPKGPDPVWQQTMGSGQQPSAPIVNFNGQDSPYFPPDCNGVAGPNHFMQTINCVYAIYNKTGTLVAGPTNMNLLFGSVPGSTYNDGDPVILYDEQADRWLATEFSISGSTNYVMMAVSTSNDPTGTWYTYSFVVASMPDYPKFSVWRDGYYMGDNNSSAKDTYVFERSKMLLGQTAQFVGFDNPYRPSSSDGFMCVPPVDNDGAFAPTGSPGLYIAFNDDAFGGGSDQLWIYELTVNWTTPTSSTFVRAQQLSVPAFDSNFGSGWDNIPQPGTTRKLDAIPQVIMNVPQYRNFGTYQTIVCCHTVDVDGTDHAGIRWYELRRTTGTWSLRQSGTYAPDAANRWMGSIMLNGGGRIGLGYSVSSSTVYPGIRYCGQSASAYNTGAGVMDIPEDVIQTGAYSQTAYNRWGDYSLLSVDPTDDQTFWFTSQYIGTGAARKTKIASFKFANNPTVTTQDATAVTSNTATINGKVNPNGLSTNYNFEWGPTVSYGSSTTVTAAGSGTSDVTVFANLNGLTGGTTYHFRLTAVNSDGNTNGSDKAFTPGAAAVTTTAASGITATTATSGGNVTLDGGSAVTARGVCWSTTVNPVVTGNHTTDGAGLGTFVSSLTSLTANTLYHIRAYATNTNGTFYGDDLQFTSSCGIISALPYNEGFEGSATRPNCWTEENSNPAWQFGAGNGGSNPATAHTGVRDAYLKDNTAASNLNKLITPVFNLTGYTNVQLTFWLFMQKWVNDQDELTVYYRTSATGSWISLQNYNTSITTWTQQTISLTTTSAEFQLAFEGNAKYGYGVCIDDIQITGSSAVPLTVLPANQNVTPPAGTTSFSVTCPVAWTATSNAISWCTVTPSGTGNGTITATYTQNTLTTPRVANVTVTASGAPTQVVTVTQAGITPTLSVSPPNQNVTAIAGTTNFTVTSNTTWTVVSDMTWCTPTASGSGNGTITANYTENPTTTPRVATLSVTVTGLPVQTVTVTQAGSAPTLAVTPANQNVTAPAGATNFAVISNTSWTVSSNSSWCVPTPSGSGNGTIDATYTENTSTSPRVATLTVTVTGLSPQTVTVTQAGAALTLSVSPQNQNVSASAGSTSFDVTSNSSWTVASNMTWCTPTSSGSGNGTISAVYTENTSVGSRIATLTVTVSGLSPVEVTVTQAGTAPTLVVQPPNRDVTSASGTTNFTVTSNSDWIASSDATWCTVTSSGTGNGTIVANYSANPDNSQRIANVLVTVSGLTPVGVTVTQAPLVSIDELSSGGIRIYPNPARGIFNIVPEGGSSTSMKITVQDLNGKIIANKAFKGSNEYQLDLSGAPEGCYNIIIHTDDQVLVRKLVIIK